MTDLPWQKRMERLCTTFGCTPDDLVDALEASPNARGYILGALAEIYLQRALVKMGYRVKRIREKWEGEKRHHGDFYVSGDEGKTWFVVECKGLKSNAEKWGGKGKHKELTGKALAAWGKRLHKGETARWWAALPPARKAGILASGSLDRAHIFQTHLVSGRGGKSGRKIATPLRSEFHLLAIDLFIRTGRHEFIFAASADLEPSPSHPDHLQQNYLIDIVFDGVDTEPTIAAPWSRDFAKAFGTLEGPVDPADMMEDDRRPGERKGEVLASLDEVSA
jgi:hypothetical protein